MRDASSENVTVLAKFFHYLWVNSFFWWEDFTRLPFYRAGVFLALSRFTEEFCYYTMFGINFGIVYDLFQTVSNPFQSTSTRISFIKWMCPTIFLLLQIYNQVYIFNPNVNTRGKIGPIEDMSYGDQRYVLEQLPFQMIIVGTYMIVSAFTCIYAVIALSRKGINREHRSIVIKRNILYQMIVMFCDSAYQINKCIVYIWVNSTYTRFEVFSNDDQEQELKFVHYLYQFKSGVIRNSYDDFIWVSWFLFFSRDIILFLYMCFSCPMFRYTVLNFPIRNRLSQYLISRNLKLNLC